MSSCWGSNSCSIDYLKKEADLEEVRSFLRKNNLPMLMNTKNYKVIKQYSYKNFIVLLLLYPDCTNYGGYKVLVFRGVQHVTELLDRNKSIDPHFLENKVSPIARFEPTNNGWLMAKTLVHSCDYINFLD